MHSALRYLEEGVCHEPSERKRFSNSLPVRLPDRDYLDRVLHAAGHIRYRVDYAVRNLDPRYAKFVPYKLVRLRDVISVHCLLISFLHNEQLLPGKS